MSEEQYRDGARLVADIGGTNARFALERGPGWIEETETLACADYPRFQDAARAYLERHGAAGAPVRHAVIAIANPVEGDYVKMTNHRWEFSLQAARTELGLVTLLAVNDFAALAMALPQLAASELVQVGGSAPALDGVIGLVGAGTGLGVAGLLPTNGRWTVLQSEGGHVAFSPADRREQEILAYCWQRWDHVSAERLVSGPGLALIHEALAARAGSKIAALEPADIVEHALLGTDPLCIETLDTFCGMLGTVAANLAVTLCARGGIYIGGGVVPRLGEWFARSSFRARFENKGRFSSFASRIPCFVIHAPYPALGGAAAMLAEHLEAQQTECAIQQPTMEVRHGHALSSQ
ncbi:glucokinase [Massilia sp. BSC265]|uniref:glucokinase n=1 Tax=Massilia sp. BSC265 TaxID=1549812 RepID=UPI0009DCB26F|nr:glucokinase [Massilia sp. BSC265]